MIKTQLTDVFEEGLDSRFSNFYDSIASNMIPYLEDGLKEKASDKILGFKELEGIVKDEFLRKVSYDSLGNLSEVSRRADISTKQVSRIFDRNQALKEYNRQNTPGNYDPMQERQSPKNDFFSPDYVLQSYTRAIDDTFEEYEGILDPRAKEMLKEKAYLIAYELADKLNSSDLVIDMPSKARAITKDTMETLSAQGYYSIKDVQEISKAAIFRYVFDSVGGDFSRTAELLKMSERNARRLHKRFLENEWGRKVVEEKELEKI